MKKLIYIFLTMLLVVGFKLSSSEAQLMMMKNPLIGEDAPAFSLNTLNGSEMSLEELRDGQKAIMFFWATWCPHCRTQLKELTANKEKIESGGIKVVLVDTGEPADTVSKFINDNGIDFEVILDEDNTLSEAYSIIGVPTFFFINEDGTVNAVEHFLPKNLDEVFG